MLHLRRVRVRVRFVPALSRPSVTVMGESVDDVGGPSSEERTRVGRRRSQDAVHTLEAFVTGAAPGREEAWRAGVLTGLRELEAAIAEQARSYEDPASLLAEIASYQPRFRTWVRQLHRQWAELSAATTSLREQLEHADEAAWEFAEIRERAGWPITALRHHRAREADLVFQALDIDLGGVA